MRSHPYSWGHREGSPPKGNGCCVLLSPFPVVPSSPSAPHCPPWSLGAVNTTGLSAHVTLPLSNAKCLAGTSSYFLRSPVGLAQHFCVLLDLF